MASMTVMTEPVPAADAEVTTNAAETAAVSDPAAASDLAWSRDDDHPSPQPAGDRQSWSATWRKAAGLLLGGLILAGAIVVVFWVLSPASKNPQPAPTPSSGAAPPATGPAAAPTIASTPQQDDKYVQALNDHGISFANPEAAVFNGKMVCDDIRRGMAVPQIVDEFRASNPALGADADAYVAISVRTYCPEHDGLVSALP